MNSRHHLLRVVLALSALEFPAAATTYSLVDLGVGVAHDINSSGRVVGNSATGGWYHDGVNRAPLAFPARYLGAPPEQLFKQTASSANAINDNGRITGHVTFPGPGGGTLTAFSYDGSGVATLLAQGEAGNGVNSGGLVVGGGGGSAFFFDGSTVTAPVGPAPRLYAVNAGGLAVGSVAPNGFELAASFSGAAFETLDLDGLSLPNPGVGAGYMDATTPVHASRLYRAVPLP